MGHANRPEVTDFAKLDASMIGKRFGVDGDTASARASYIAPDGKSVDATLSLIATPCRFGGRRWWWQCPVCGRRAAFLYAAPAGVACRICLHAGYPSQNEFAFGRAIMKRNKLMALLVDSNGRPRRMWWKTFNRIRTELDECENVALANLERITERMKESGHLSWR